MRKKGEKRRGTDGRGIYRMLSQAVFSSVGRSNRRGPNKGASRHIIQGRRARLSNQIPQLLPLGLIRIVRDPQIRLIYVLNLLPTLVLHQFSPFGIGNFTTTNSSLHIC